MARANGGKRSKTFSPTVHANRRTKRIRIGEDWAQGNSIEDFSYQIERMDDDYQEWFGRRPMGTKRW